MARKFNLAELMGETVSNLNTENAKEQEIPLADIEENAANIYAQTDIEELAESIKVAGLMQPLVVWPKPDGGYLLLAGHRRRNAIEQLGWNTAPCRVLDKNFDPALRTLVLHWTNTMVRGGGGLTAPYIAQAAKEIEEALKDLQARGVVELPGKLRSYIADVLDKNESAVQRAQYIDKHLDRQWKEKLCRKSIKESIADEIAHCEPGLQADLYRVYNDKLFSLDARKVKAHRKAAEFDFTPLTCPEASPGIEPCTGADKRAAWVKGGRCEGCCHECSLAANCDRVCGKVKQRIEREKNKVKDNEERERRLAEFNASPLAEARRNIRFALACKDIRCADDFEDKRFRWNMSWLWASQPFGCVPDLAELFEMAASVGIDPFEMIADHPACSIWHKYTEERPPEGARVLCKLCGCSNRYGEYVYRDGKWFFPDLDDEACEANILVSAWTEVFPE